MNAVRFADGFDGPDLVAFGLGPAQLVAAVIGLLSAYAVLGSPLPLYGSMPLGILLLMLAGVLGWCRHEGRPAIDWCRLTIRYLASPRTGILIVEMLRPPPPAAPPPMAQPDQPAAERPTPGPGVTVAPSSAPRTQRLTFFSMNGGSGRTTLATEVACLLAAHVRESGHPGAPPERLRVALLDVDPLGATVAMRLGLPQPGFREYALTGRGRAARPDRCLVRHGSGVRALLGPPNPLPPAAESAEPARLAKLVEQLEAEGTDFIVIDIGPGFGPIATWVLNSVHAIYIVVTPTSGGVQDAYRSTAALRRLGQRHKLAYVANRSRGGFDLREVLADLSGRLVGEIPLDPRLEMAENEHRPVGAAGGDGPAARALIRLAARIHPPRFPG